MVPLLTLHVAGVGEDALDRVADEILCQFRKHTR